MNVAANLSKPQWDAALAAADQLRLGNPALADDRARYRAAKAALTNLLPDARKEEAGQIILAAVRWDARNSIAAELAGIGVVAR